MSGKVDERVVELKFNTKDFENGVKDTTENLAQLEQALNMEGVGSAIENISSKFSAFGAIAFTALQTLTNAAIGFGNKIAGAILDPLVEGGRKRALNIEQAKFQFKGLGMDVEQSMADALYAVKNTAFGLDEAAVAASQFGASGIKSGAEMQSALRGIAGVAAMAGSSYTDMANVFTKVAGQGRLMGDDLNRLGVRGINAASTLADYFNKTGLAVNATEADIRSMVTKGEIDFKTFAAAMSDAFGEHATAANQTFTGSLSNMRAALARIGAMYFTPELERMRTIFNALTPAIDSVATAIAPLMKLFHQFADDAAKNLVSVIEGIDFTPLINAAYSLMGSFQRLGAFIGRIGTSIGNAFKEVFGNTSLVSLQTITTAFAKFTYGLEVTAEAGHAIKTVFVGIFTVIKTVIDIVIAVGTVLWSVFSNVAKLIGSVLSVFYPLIQIFGRFETSTEKSSEGVVSLSQKFANFIDKAVRPAISFFEKLADVMAGLVDSKLAVWMTDTAASFTPLEWIGDKIVGLFGALKTLAVGTWNVIKPIFDSIGNAFSQLGKSFAEASNGIDFGILLGAANTGILFWFANAIKNLFSGGFEEISKITGIMDKIDGIFEQVTGTLEAMQTKLKAEALMKIALAIGILAASMFLLGSINPENIGSAVAGMVTVTSAMIGVMFALDKLTTMKGAAKLPFIAASMILVATSLLVLSVALKIMATMSWDEIGRGLTVLAGAMIVMVGAMILLSNVGLKATVAAAGMAIMANAILVLAIALKIMGTMSWEDIAQGLAVLAGAMIIMVIALQKLGDVGPKAIVAAAAMAIMSGALLTLSGVIRILGSMDMGQLAQGLIAMTIGLGVMIGALLILGKFAPQAVAASFAMLIMAAAIGVLTAAVYVLGSMDMGTLIQGLIGLTVALGILVGAVLLLGIAGPLALLGAAAILVMSAAILILTVAISALGLLPADAIAQGIGTIAAALGIMVGFGLVFGILAPIFMAGGLALGVLALSLLVIAASMALFAISLGLFAANADGAAQGLFTLSAAMMSILPAVPIFAILGSALIIFGAGALVAGVGITVLGVGLMAMALALGLISMTAPAGAIALILLTNALIPMVAEGLKLAGLGAAFLVLGAGLLVLGAGALVAGAGMIVLATGLRMVGSVADKGIKALEKVVEAVAGMVFQLPQLALMAAGFLALGAALLALGAGAMLAGAGSLLLVSGLMLLGIAATMGAAAMAKVNTAVAAMAPSAPMLTVIAASVGILAAAFAAAAAGGAGAAAGITAMIVATSLGTASVVAFAAAVSGSIPVVIAMFGLLGPAALAAALVVAQSFLQIQNGIISSIPPTTIAVIALVAAITTNLISRMNAQAGSMRAAGSNAGYYLSAGVASGISNGQSLAVNAAIRLASAAIRALNAELQIRSPSRKAAKSGFFTGAGFGMGMDKSQGVVETAAEGLADTALGSLSKAMSLAANAVMDTVDVHPTITPVLDLSSVKKDASGLSNLFGNETLPVASNYQVASNISTMQQDQAQVRADAQTENVENISSVTFNQTINAPKAPNTSEVYRQTKNQISTAKDKLKV